MSARDNEIINKLIEKYGTLWSISRLKTYETCPYQYYLNYVLKLESNDNAYGVQGGNAHDTLESFYNGEISYEDIHKIFCEKFTYSSQVDQVKFPGKEKEEDKWFKSVSHFMRTHVPIKYKRIGIENLVLIRLDGHCFRGYIDVISIDEEDKVTILDWKTSTMFKGKDIKKMGQQLILYKLAVEHNHGLKVDKLCWNMLKYCTLHYEVNGVKYTEKNVERCYLAREKVKIMRKFTEMKDFDIQEVLFDTNRENWEIFPEYGEYNFKVSDCIVEYEPTQQDILDCVSGLVNNIESILENGTMEEMFPAKNAGSFFCNSLCGHKHQCKECQK